MPSLLSSLVFPAGGPARQEGQSNEEDGKSDGSESRDRSPPVSTGAVPSTGQGTNEGYIPGKLSTAGMRVENTTAIVFDLESPAFKTPHEEEEPGLKDLNAALEVLVEIFPDVRPDVFREMLREFGEESRLQLVTEAILRHGQKYVKGRFRAGLLRDTEEVGGSVGTGQKTTAGDSCKGSQRKLRSMNRHVEEVREKEEEVLLAAEDMFRSPAYKYAVKATLYAEFRGLSHATIKAVMAENNFSYTLSRPTLLQLVSKSWTYSITAFFTRRKLPSADSHPLITWSPSALDPSVLVPRLKLTASAQLNRELYDIFIAPTLMTQRGEQEALDWKIALQLNEQEAEEAGASFECGCCFGSYPFESVVVCDGGNLGVTNSTDGEGGDDRTAGLDGSPPHFLCFDCVRNAMQAALYGQGWSNAVDLSRGTLRCFTSTTDSCNGCIPASQVRQALLQTAPTTNRKDEKAAQQTWEKFEERLAADQLRRSSLPAVYCPFCGYAEIEELSDSARLMPLLQHTRIRPVAAAVVASVFTLLVVALMLYPLFRFIARYPIMVVFFSVTANYLFPYPPVPLHDVLRTSILRQMRCARGYKFSCLRPTCRKSSCLRCGARWRDMHRCFASSLEALRRAVENAAADAVKRTCPACGTSFVKSSGCNKLTCPCGYTMCYVCRAHVGTREGYTHFCQHFRERPGPCHQCGKCDLYKGEDEEVVVKRAKERAEREWKEREGGEGGRVVLERRRREGWWGSVGEEWLDWFVGLLVEVEP
ncbi:hypothetical protein BDY21DRAFT_358265 [Lineolata rhizophorae]|uniref:RING-type domain-containing protein n=1 Tax=Lineolata rhizophorae TaxID=578093 RepID=A0A6A6NM56_9PEZI|nr:hypothetical protein BDY21DRAFT_358265 [Lineolata rhizophorae]